MNQSISIETASNEELREWLAKYYGYTLEKHGWAKRVNGRLALARYPYIPIQNTIEEAQHYFPTEWTWTCSNTQWMAWNNEKGLVSVPRTPDERTDRFRLAVMVYLKIEEGL